MTQPTEAEGRAIVLAWFTDRDAHPALDLYRAAVRRAVVEEIVEKVEGMPRYALVQAEDEHSPAFMQVDRRGAFVMAPDLQTALRALKLGLVEALGPSAHEQPVLDAVRRVVAERKALEADKARHLSGLRVPTSPEARRGELPLTSRVHGWHPDTKNPEAIERDKAKLAARGTEGA